MAVGKFNVDLCPCNDFDGAPQGPALRIADQGETARQHLRIAERMEKLIEVFEPPAGKIETRADGARKTLVERPEPVRCRAQPLAFEMAARRKRGAEPSAHMIELLDALLLRGFDAARKPMLDPFELLRRARHFRLRRLAGETVGEAGQSEAAPVQSLRLGALKGACGAVASLPRQSDDLLALRQRPAEAAQIGPATIKKT